MTQTFQREDIIVPIGQRVRLTNKHPWAGSNGRILQIQNTPWGMKPVVETDSGIRCFIMAVDDFISLRG